MAKWPRLALREALQGFRIVFRFGAAFLAVATTPALAQEASAPKWICWYQGEPEPSVACRLLRAPGPEAVPTGVPQWMESMPPR